MKEFKRWYEFNRCKFCDKFLERKQKSYCNRRCSNAGMYIGLSTPLKYCLRCNKLIKIKSEKRYVEVRFCSNMCNNMFRKGIKRTGLSRECKQILSECDKLNDYYTIGARSTFKG